MRIHLITAESPESRRLRGSRYSLGSIARRMWGSRTGVWWNLPRNLGYHLAQRRYPEQGWDPGQAEPLNGQIRRDPSSLALESHEYLDGSGRVGWL
jgi:hypothetical protein